MLQVAALAMRGGAPGRGPASKHAYQAPNVLVAHLEEGIEAVHLYSGRTLCKLHLPPSGLHADLNGDGVLDHVQARAVPCVVTLLRVSSVLRLVILQTALPCAFSASCSGTLQAEIGVCMAAVIWSVGRHAPWQASRRGLSFLGNPIEMLGKRAQINGNSI